jgi:hypothetical protein
MACTIDFQVGVYADAAMLCQDSILVSANGSLGLEYWDSLLSENNRVTSCNTQFCST